MARALESGGVRCRAARARAEAARTAHAGGEASERSGAQHRARGTRLRFQKRVMHGEGELRVLQRTSTNA